MITILGGSFMFPDGGVVSNGTAILKLSWDSTETVTNPYGTVVAGEPIVIPLDANGNLTPTLIWGNSELSVSTYYEMSLYNSSGVPLLKTPIIWIFTESSGSIVNVGDVPNQGNVPGNTVVPVQGAKGDTGIQGPVGPQGPAGTFNSPTPPIKTQIAAIDYVAGTEPALSIVQKTGLTYPSFAATINLGVSPTVGNTLVFLMSGGHLTITPPAGLTEISSVINGTQTAKVWKRVVQAGDGTSWAFDGGTDSLRSAVLQCYEILELHQFRPNWCRHNSRRHLFSFS